MLELGSILDQSGSVTEWEIVAWTYEPDRYGRKIEAKGGLMLFMDFGREDWRGERSMIEIDALVQESSVLSEYQSTFEIYGTQSVRDAWDEGFREAFQGWLEE